MPSQSHSHDFEIFLPSADSTDHCAKIFAQHCQMGDTLLLSGPVGAGKSHFARALIRHFFGQDQEVPSPSFTLVQTYTNAHIEIWHADLYRLGHSDEIIELGLEDAMGAALCLIEWPEKLGPNIPKNAIHIKLRAKDDGRVMQLSGARADLQHSLHKIFTP
jgi:tRNA threonylcarbamoyladenosine biosynthesis protein TsaE